MAVEVIRDSEPDDSEIYFDLFGKTYEVKVWDAKGRLLKHGTGYRTEQTARFAEKRMMGFRV